MLGLFDSLASLPGVEIDRGPDAPLRAAPQDIGVERIQLEAPLPISMDKPLVPRVAALFFSRKFGQA